MAFGLDLLLCGLDCLPWPPVDLFGEQVSVIRRLLPLGDYLRVPFHDSDGCSPRGRVGLVASVAVSGQTVIVFDPLTEAPRTEF